MTDLGYSPSCLTGRASGEQAADLLNVSRTTVIRLIENGEPSARYAGTHRHIPLDELLSFRDEMITRRCKAVDDMVTDAEALNLHD